jgi:hypothetical protein
VEFSIRKCNILDELCRRAFELICYECCCYCKNDNKSLKGNKIIVKWSSKEKKKKLCAKNLLKNLILLKIKIKLYLNFKNINNGIIITNLKDISIVAK